MDGKSLLFKEFAGIDAFPICLETQDVDEIVNIVKNIAPTLGGINLEDISAPRCFRDRRKTPGGRWIYLCSTTTSTVQPWSFQRQSSMLRKLTGQQTR